MNNVPESMDFTSIFHGMVGRDFIRAFNDNFNLTDRTFVALLAEMIYKVKSTDIKEFRIQDGAVQYTLDNENVEERDWKFIDITAWGNIKGDLYEQADLKTALDSKAAATAVESLASLVNSLNMSVGNLTSSMETANSNINTNTNSIADLVRELNTRVKSTTVKELRLTEETLEWSPDGINWYSQEVMNTVSWGSIKGDISQQSDLYQHLTKLDRDVESLGNTVSSHTTALTEIRNTLNELAPKVEANTSNISTMNTTLENVRQDVDSLSTDKADNTTLVSHINNHENPHVVTKEQIGLDKVDNTPDMEKPVSTPQQSYISETVSNALSEIEGAVTNKKNIYGIALVSPEEFSSGGAGLLANTLVFVTDKVDFDVKIASTELSEVSSTSTIGEAELEISSEVEEL